MSLRHSGARAILLLLAAGTVGAGDSFTLITREDVAAEQRFEATPAGTRDLSAPAPASAAQLPRIIVVAPHPGAAPLASPLKIELAFETIKDARILPESLHVKYGFLKIDITERLKPYARVTEKGLVADNAAIPAGSHRLFLEISDSAGRTATSQMQFTVMQ